jgi:uncharacterized Zn-finger protein
VRSASNAKNAVSDAFEFSNQILILPGKRYKRLDNLRAHLLVHEGNKPFVCGMPFIIELLYLVLILL